MTVYCKLDATVSDIRKHYTEAINDAWMMYVIMFGIFIFGPFVTACCIQDALKMSLSEIQGYIIIGLAVAGILLLLYPDAKVLFLSFRKTPSQLLQALYTEEASLFLLDDWLALAYFTAINNGQFVVVDDNKIDLGGYTVKLPETENKEFVQLIVGSDVVLE